MTNQTTAGSGVEAGAGVAAAEHVVRALETPGDYAACVALQRVVWGAVYGTVPGALIKVSQRVGGVAAGAFARDGTLHGFVFGLTGVADGRLVHWSHMLAVDPAVRDRGLGGRLKAFQLDAARALGVERVEWTFDPLVARNAHRNVNGLSVRVEAYVVDMYPDTGSALHTFGTDRLVVSVSPSQPRVRLGPLSAAARSAPVMNGAGGAGEAAGAPVVRIRIPSDVETLAAHDLAAARAWRASTRAAFQRLLAGGYRVIGFDRESDGHGAYVLARG